MQISYIWCSTDFGLILQYSWSGLSWYVEIPMLPLLGIEESRHFIFLNLRESGAVGKGGQPTPYMGDSVSWQTRVWGGGQSGLSDMWLVTVFDTYQTSNFCFNLFDCGTDSVRRNQSADMWGCDGIIKRALCWFSESSSSKGEKCHQLFLFQTVTCSSDFRQGISNQHALVLPPVDLLLRNGKWAKERKHRKKHR